MILNEFKKKVQEMWINMYVAVLVKSARQTILIGMCLATQASYDMDFYLEIDEYALPELKWHIYKGKFDD